MNFMDVFCKYLVTSGVDAWHKGDLMPVHIIDLVILIKKGDS